MSEYKCLEELASMILGKSCNIEEKVAEDTKGKGSTQIRLTVTPTEKCINGLGLPEEPIFAKKNDRDSSVCKLLHVVEKESIMYDEVIPCVLKFLTEKNYQLHSHIRSLFPLYHGRGIVSSNHFFLFEDFFHSQSDKFKVTDSDTFHNDGTVHLVMKSIAKLHGVFHSIKNFDDFHFKDKYPILSCNYLLEKTSYDVVAPFYNGEFHKTLTLLQVVLDCYSKDSCEIVRSKLKMPQNDTCDIQMSLRKLKMLVCDPLKLMENMRKREKAETSILIHGDFHPLNIAVSDSGVRFFDYQLIRFSDGLSDVHQYLSQGTSPEQRQKNLTSYLESYHKTLGETCKELGMIGSPYGNMDSFISEYMKFSPLQIPYGFGFLIWKYVTDLKAYEHLADLLKEFESSGSNDKTILHDNCIKFIDKLGPRIWYAIQILFEFVIEIQVNGILDQI
jgi:hypothetical protein